LGVDLGQGRYFGILEQWNNGRMGNAEKKRWKERSEGGVKKGGDFKEGEGRYPDADEICSPLLPEASPWRKGSLFFSESGYQRD
jgi:hypothetical protein